MSTDPDLTNQTSDEIEPTPEVFDDGVREIFPVRFDNAPTYLDFRPIAGDPDEPELPDDVQTVGEVLDELGKDGDVSVPASASSPDVTLNTGLPKLMTGVQLPAS